MAKTFLNSEIRPSIAPAPIMRGQQKDIPLNAVIIGGGKACYSLLKMLDLERLSRPRLNILGVSDRDPKAPGFQYAKTLDIFTTTNFHELFTLATLNLIIELTGLPELSAEIDQSKPAGVSFVDFRTAQVFWDIFQIEEEKAVLERERLGYEERFIKDTQVILDSLPYRIMVVNLDRSIHTVNQTFLREFNLTREKVLGRRCHEIRYGLGEPCSSEGDICFLGNQLEALKEKRLISHYQEYVDDRGESRFDVITIAPIFNEKGEIIQLLEASRDVTERFKFEREAQKSNIFFQNVIQSTVDGIVVVDTKGNVLIFNEGMEKLTGYTADEIINRGHLSSFYNIDVAKENMRKMRSDNYGSPGKLNPTTMTVTTKQGEEIPITLSASIITIDGKEIGSVGVFTDMREILQMRKNLEDAHLQLVQSEKIASVGRMAAGVAHEINNPLAGIMIYAELLKEAMKDDPQNLKDIQEIIDQTLRCKKIVSELLEFSRQSVGKVSSFSLEEMINKSLNLLVNQALFQDILVEREIKKDLPNMVGDMGQLQQVFTNLFINAADAMQGKGRLVIQADYDQDEERFTIRISDTGPGIPETLRDKIFDIFFTTKQVGKGTGLGLSISQNIIKLHGGDITLNCPAAGGTTFVIDLPLGFVEQTSEGPLFLGLDK